MKTLYWTASRLRDKALTLRDRHGDQIQALEKAAKILIEEGVDEVLILKQILLVKLPEDDSET